MQLICQWVLLVCYLLNFFTMVYQDFNGRPAREPAGFRGFVTSLLVLVASLALLVGSGALSLVVEPLFRSG